MKLFFYFLLLLGVWASDSNRDLNHYEKGKAHEDYLSPLNLRSISDYSLSDNLLISDIDGNLHSIDRHSGSLIWTLNSDPLVTIVNNSSENSNVVWFVEPYEDGSLYYFTNEYGLNKLPTSIKELVLQSPFSLDGDNNIYTGTRKTQLFTIDINTGEILKSFGGDKCLNFDNNGDKKDQIMIGKTTYELTIHSKINSNIIWYVTYSQWGPNNIDNDLIIQNKKSIDELYFTPFHDKSLLGINQNLGTPVWITKLPSLAINVFDIFSDSERTSQHLIPHPLKVLNDLQMTEDSQNLCFINHTNNQWYAMSFNNYPTLIKSAPISEYQKAVYDFEFTQNPSALAELEKKGIDYISGIHKYHSLGPETNYHPVSKFRPQEIDQGIEEHSGNYDLIIPDQTVPNIIQGIKFGTSDNQLIPTSPQEADKMFETYLPDIYPKREITTFSVVKRICEDMIVLLFLLALFVSISKFGAFTRQFRRKEERVEEGEEKKKVSFDVKITDKNDTKNEEKIEDGEDVEDKEEKEKKKRKRGARGGKRSKRKPTPSSDGEEEEEETIIPTTSLVKQIVGKQQIKKLQIENNLVISNKILGYGSHGTVVYQGTFENRPVAVKRMLLDFYDVANHEVSLLQQSDDHPNVVRYFCSQTSMSEKFLYIALELCQGSLEDLIEKQLKISQKIEANDLLYQLTHGLHYLHNLKIVHRDLKPQNILIGDNLKEIRLLISDFGLCKKLDNDQSSFRATHQNEASGTSGWRAPELLLNNDISEISPSAIASSKRLTKAIDIFSLGCIFFYILTGGYHPFGDRYLREGHIIKGDFDLSLLNKLPDKYELKDLISQMINFNPSLRPNTFAILKHPLFWSKGKKLEFLLKVSDRFEIERRDPPSELLLRLEAVAKNVTKNWHDKFDEEFLSNLGKYRKYQSDKLMDLLRALRNKYHHFNDMPTELQLKMSPLPNGFYDYFNKKFPNLLMEVYYVVEELKGEHIFEEYY